MRKPLLALTLAAALAAASCGGDEEAAVEGAATTPAPTEAPTEEPAAAGGDGATLKFSAPADGSLKFDQEEASTQAGTVTVEFANPSPVPHAVAIEGNGVDETGETVTDADAAPLTVELEAGTYEFYCPVGSHADAGMKGTLTVE
jgi:plastocyanin